MSDYSSIRREAARLLAALKKRVPKKSGPLPFIVKQVAWTTTGDGDTAPDVTEWNAVVNGERPELVSDMPGWEAHNAELDQVRGIVPKLYLFDPDAEFGVDP